MLYLTEAPVGGTLRQCRNASYSWDGAGSLTLMLHGGKRRSELHFKPGDAVRVLQQNGVVKLTRVTEPESLAAAVLWFIGVERGARCRDEEDYVNRVACFQDRTPMKPGEEFELIHWDAADRVPRSGVCGTHLYELRESDLRLARCADARGKKWADIAAWCDPQIDPQRAYSYVLRYRVDHAPLWYVQKVLNQVK